MTSHQVGHWPLVADGRDRSGNGYDAAVVGAVSFAEIGASFDRGGMLGSRPARRPRSRRRHLHGGGVGAGANQPGRRPGRYLHLLRSRRTDRREPRHPARRLDGQSSQHHQRRVRHRQRQRARMAGPWSPRRCARRLGHGRPQWAPVRGNHEWAERPSRSCTPVRRPRVGGSRAGGPGERGERPRILRWPPLRRDRHAIEARARGLADLPNQHPGGEVFKLAPDRDWEPCGQLAGADFISGFAVQAGALYATALYQRGIHRYDGEDRWVSCGDPGRRLLALGVFDGHLFGAGNDHVNVDEALERTRRGEVVEAVEPGVAGACSA